MPDPDLVSRQRCAPTVEYRMFYLRDPHQRDSPLGEDVPALDEILRPGPNGVVFRSGGNNFAPDVTLEVWRSEPARDPGDWDERADAVFAAPSATVRLLALSGELAGDDVTLPPADRYYLRAYTRGRGEAMERLTTVDRFYRGVEEWLVQIWPRL
jgi:hypothetical protein